MARKKSGNHHHSRRQAVSEILSAIILVSVGTAIAASISIHLAVSHDEMRCEITSFDIFKISDHNSWMAIDAFNTGDLEIKQYSITLYDGQTKILIDAQSSANILASETFGFEGSISQGITESQVLVEVVVQNQEQYGTCFEELEI